MYERTSADGKYLCVGRSFITARTPLEVGHFYQAFFTENFFFPIRTKIFPCVPERFLVYHLDAFHSRAKSTKWYSFGFYSCSKPGSEGNSSVPHWAVTECSRYGKRTIRRDIDLSTGAPAATNSWTNLRPRGPKPAQPRPKREHHVAKRPAASARHCGAGRRVNLRGRRKLGWGDHTDASGQGEWLRTWPQGWRATHFHRRVSAWRREIRAHEFATVVAETSGGERAQR